MGSVVSRPWASTTWGSDRAGRVGDVQHRPEHAGRATEVRSGESARDRRSCGVRPPRREQLVRTRLRLDGSRAGAPPGCPGRRRYPRSPHSRFGVAFDQASAARSTGARSHPDVGDVSRVGPVPSGYRAVRGDCVSRCPRGSLESEVESEGRPARVGSGVRCMASPPDVPPLSRDGDRKRNPRTYGTGSRGTGFGSRDGARRPVVQLASWSSEQRRRPVACARLVQQSCLRGCLAGVADGTLEFLKTARVSGPPGTTRHHRHRRSTGIVRTIPASGSRRPTHGDSAG